MKDKKVAEALASAVERAPPIRGPILTIQQFEERHPGTKNRMRHYILHADAGCAGYDGLKVCVIRIGRSVMLDESGVLDWLSSHSGHPPSPARNPHGRAGLSTGKRIRP
jgi:hypothetical protein